MAARPLVTVHGLDGKAAGQTQLPAVFTAPLRVDIVQTVHTHLNKNHRQPYAPARNAGHQTAAESWGTGRAVSRIPRVPGGGTHRAGQGAFGNMCRGGHMFAPNKIWRRWHRRVNVNLKRYATCSALAATALPSLVLARGHKVESLPEVPLVLADEVQSITKTKQAVDVLTNVGAYKDVERAIASRNLRRGKGKMRNRRYVMRKGPLIIYKDDTGLVQAMRNIPGVDLCHIDRLNLLQLIKSSAEPLSDCLKRNGIEGCFIVCWDTKLTPRKCLQLAPGGHLGRFCIWTKSAFDALDSIYGSQEEESKVKKGYKLPRLPMANTDLARLINSDEIQSVVNEPKEAKRGKTLKKNPLKNLGSMLKLNPYSKTIRRLELANQEARQTARAERIAAIRAGTSKSARTTELKSSAKAFVCQMRADSDYTGEDYEVFAKWLSQGHGDEKGEE